MFWCWGGGTICYIFEIWKKQQQQKPGIFLLYSETFLNWTFLCVREQTGIWVAQVKLAKISCMATWLKIWFIQDSVLFKYPNPFSCGIWYLLFVYSIYIKENYNEEVSLSFHSLLRFLLECMCTFHTVTFLFEICNTIFLFI